MKACVLKIRRPKTKISMCSFNAIRFILLTNLDQSYNLYEVIHLHHLPLEAKSSDVTNEPPNPPATPKM